MHSIPQTVTSNISCKRQIPMFRRKRYHNFLELGLLGEGALTLLNWTNATPFTNVKLSLNIYAFVSGM